MADNSKEGADRPTEMVTFRMSQAELARLTETAQKLGLARSVLIRESVNAVVKDAGHSNPGHNPGHSSHAGMLDEILPLGASLQTGRVKEK